MKILIIKSKIHDENDCCCKKNQKSNWEKQATLSNTNNNYKAQLYHDEHKPCEENYNFDDMTQENCHEIIILHKINIILGCKSDMHMTYTHLLLINLY